jgi:hypothetical protein
LNGNLFNRASLPNCACRSTGWFPAPAETRNRLIASRKKTMQASFF